MRWIVVPVIALGMLVIVPLGLRLLEAPGLGGVRRWWRPAAAAGVVALLLPAGPPAAAIAVLYAAATVALAATAARRLTAAGGGSVLRPAEVAAATALVTPAVAGISLVAERGGWELLGFGPKILLLTVAHFHFAGFAAALVAGLVGRLPDAGRAASAAALTVPVGTLLVLAGFFLGDYVELAGAAVLTLGMWVVGALTWHARSATPDRVTRVLLATSAAVLVVTMVLALDWALGNAVGVPALSLTWMAATHGILNAVGFALCAVLAWGRLSSR
ncbi:YndJ family protein [Cryptosporangium sp. NPDC051539]|uniref:YndJ family protein n=1 Tax=Cryptosporangium sp. NPDC051539 TaxID=3363962 RepID=UPI0037AB61FE